jgi:hypothetical protein
MPCEGIENKSGEYSHLAHYSQKPSVKQHLLMEGATVKMIAAFRAILEASLLLTFPVAGSASLYWYSVTDPSGAGSGTQYVLEINPIDLNTNYYSATLTAKTDANSGWYIDWFAIKFDGGTTGVISPITSLNAPGADWVVGNGTVDFFKYTDFPNNTWTGAYDIGLTSNQYNGGVALDGNTYTWSFDFVLNAPFNPSPSFQVGYYGPLAGGSNNVSFNRMSETFWLPEPGTLVLLGSGLLGLGLYQRKQRK